MENQDIWLVYHKAKPIDNRCSLALDGSEYFVGICVVPAVGILEAILPIKDYLLEDYMELLDISKCARYKQKDFNDLSDVSVEINLAVTNAKLQNKITSACYISSEVLAYMEELEND